jgi:UDP-N-acetylmuramate--alanine ligase
VLFQPHLYSRTKQFLDEFAASFNDADEVILLPIYAAREKADPNISSQMLVDKLKENDVDATLATDFANAESLLRERATSDTLILTQGAGDIYQVADNLLHT